MNSMRVLCIQSHVVHGCVGNRSAVFPLQVLGIDVDFVNTVQFSNHTGYPTFGGDILTGDKLKDLYEHLKANNLHRYTHILTGYVTNSDLLQALADIIVDIKKEQPNVKYYCDPVLGDAGRLYVPAELITVYKEKILPLADAIFPNQFEAELLTGCRIKNETSALDSIDLLHSQFHVPTVVVTSTDVTQHTAQVNPDSSGLTDKLIMGYASRVLPRRQDIGQLERNGDAGLENGGPLLEQIRFAMPYFNARFTGTGDMFAALSLARLESRNFGTESDVTTPLSVAFESVISTMQAVLKRTITMATAVKKEQPDLPESAALELKLVQSLDDIRNPQLGNFVTSL